MCVEISRAAAPVLCLCDSCYSSAERQLRTDNSVLPKFQIPLGNMQGILRLSSVARLNSVPKPCPLTSRGTARVPPLLVP